MMGSSNSYKGAGGSLSSSSNLSALAPPFKVDKPLPKPNSTTNPSMSFSEVPVYGTVFDPAGPFWNSSSPSSTETMGTGTNTSCVTSPSIYYPGSQSSNLVASVYYVGSSGGTAYDPFSYDLLPHSVSATASADEAGKAYYSPYVSPTPPPKKDGYLGLGVGCEAGYDLLSNSGSANLNGCGSSQVDRTQGSSVGGEFKPKWGDFWMGVNDGDHGKWTEYAQGFGSSVIDVSGLSGNTNHISVDGNNKNYPSVDGSNKIHHFGDERDQSHLKQGACQSQGLESYRKMPTVSNNCFDIFGGVHPFGSLGIDQQDCKSSFDLNSGGTSSVGSKVPTFVSASISKESPHLQEPVLESVTNFCGSQKASGSSFEELFPQSDSFVFGCTSGTSTSPITVTKSCGNSFSQTTLSGTIMNSMGSNASAGYDFPYQKDPQAPRGLKCQSGIIGRRSVSSGMSVSSSQIGATVDMLAGKDASDCGKFTPQVPYQFSSDVFHHETDDAEAICSTEKHSGGTDVHNPAEDSPCWKGASSTRFSPFGVSEAVGPDVVKRLDGCKSLSSQLENKSVFVDTSDAIDPSFKRVSESTSIKRPSDSTRASKGHEDSGSMNQKPRCFDLNTGTGLQFVDDCRVYTEDSSLLNKTKTEFDSCLATHKILEDGELSCARKLSDAAAAENYGNCTPVAAHIFSGVPLPSNISHDLSSSPARDKITSENCQSSMKVSDPNIDINVLVKTMANLSELFCCYCISTPAAVMEQHSMTIKHIIDNLTSSMPVMPGSTSPRVKISSQGTSFQKERLASEMSGSQVYNAEAVAASLKLCRGTEDSLDSVSFKDDANTLGDDNMTEAIKKILHENLQGEEETDPEKLLYKNLWLEAEAALCSMTAKARLHRMKIEMGRTHTGTIDPVKPPDSKISSDVHGVVELASKDKDSPSLVVCDHEPPKPSPTSLCNDTAVSVVRNFHIPISQETSLNSKKSEAPGPAREEICSSSLNATSPDTSCDNSIVSDTTTTNHDNDAETSVTVRYQILKDRIDKSDSLKCEGKQSLDEENTLLEKDYLDLDSFGNNSHGPGSNTNDAEISVLARYHILKCRVDSSDSLNCEGKPSSGEEIFFADNVSLNADKPFNNSLLSNSIGVSDDSEASVITRFRVIQSRMNALNSMNNPTPADDGGWSQQKCNVMRTTFGPYPDFTEDENVKEFDIWVNGEASTTLSSKATNRLNSKIFESWYDQYDNDCSSTDWEHISKEDIRRQS